jgi:hypothetical protein
MKYYVYLHYRNSDHKVFYVGKGSGKRAWTTKRSKHWKSVVIKHGYYVQIIAYWNTEQDAFDHETLLIDCFKELGHPLTNKTNGGEGTAGLTPWNKGRTDLTNIVGIKTGTKRPGVGGVKKGTIPWNKGKTSLLKGIPRSQETKNKIKATKALKPWKASIEQRNKLSQAKLRFNQHRV